MDKKFAVILAAAVLILGGVFVLNGDSDESSLTNTAGSSHIVGANTGGVAIVEYADFECPACYSFYPIVKSVKEKYGDQISFQFVHFPLTQIHPKAMAAHKAAQAAHNQGKFWEFHDKLYEQRNVWAADGISIEATEKYFESYATELALNNEQFKNDSRSQAVNDIIKADMQKGNQLNVRSTPSFFINGTALDSETQSEIRDINKFYELIDAELAKNSTASPAPTATPAP